MPCMMASYLDPEFEMPPHVWLMSEAIADAVHGGGGHILITMPPRNGKSLHCSWATPVWFLENWPKKTVLLGTYGDAFGAKWGRDVRDTFEQNPDKLLTTVKQDARSASEWYTPERGGMQTAGAPDGPFTGKGGDLIIIDDPIKSASEAASEVYREKMWEWWTKVAYPRREPGCVVVVIHTRWHEDDLIGRLLEQVGGPDWQIINFPAIAEEDDVLGRHEGDALWPERYDVKAYEDIRNAVGSKTWASLYQQRPSPAGGEVFRSEYFCYFTDADPMYYELFTADGQRKRFVKDQCWKAQVVDTAMTEKQQSDFTVCITFAVTPEQDVLVCEVARERLSVPKQYGWVTAQREKWCHLPNWRWQGIENKASGIGLIQTAQLHAQPLKILEANQSKMNRATITDSITRATPASVRYENRKVYHLRDAPWLDTLERELLSFPSGKYDDQVDCIAHMALNITAAPIQPPRNVGATRYKRRSYAELNDEYGVKGGMDR